MTNLKVCDLKRRPRVSVLELVSLNVPKRVVGAKAVHSRGETEICCSALEAKPERLPMEVPRLRFRMRCDSGDALRE